MQDIGEQSAGVVMDVSKQLIELFGKIVAYLINKAERKSELKQQINAHNGQEQLSFFKGQIAWNKMLKARDARFMNLENLNEDKLKMFNELAKKAGIQISWMKFDEGRYTLCYREKDIEMVKNITEQMHRDVKLQALQNMKKEQCDFRVTDYNSVLNDIGKDVENGRQIDKRIYVASRSNPENCLCISPTLPKEHRGTKYVDMEFSFLNNGKSVATIVATNDEKSKNLFIGSFANPKAYKWVDKMSDLKERRKFGEEVIVFESKEKYEEFTRVWQEDKQKAEKVLNHNSMIEEEVEKIRDADDIVVNERQNTKTFAEACLEAQEAEKARNHGFGFKEIFDRKQEVGSYDEKPFYVVEATDPDNYIYVESEPSVFRGESYNLHTYHLFVDDAEVTNPKSSDGKFTDVRFDGRGKNYWKNLTDDMKAIGNFSDNVVSFRTKEEMMEYRTLYQQYKAQIQEAVIAVETEFNREDFKDYGKVIENLNMQMEEYKKELATVGHLEENKFMVDKGNGEFSSIDLETLQKYDETTQSKISECVIVGKQIQSFETLNTKMNELAEKKLQLEVIENQEVKGSYYHGMVNEYKSRVEKLESELSDVHDELTRLAEKRNQLQGAKAVITLKEDGIAEHNISREEKGNFVMSKESISKYVDKKMAEKKTESIHKAEHTLEKVTRSGGELER